MTHQNITQNRPKITKKERIGKNWESFLSGVLLIQKLSTSNSLPEKPFSDILDTERSFQLLCEKLKKDIFGMAWAGRGCNKEIMRLSAIWVLYVPPPPSAIIIILGQTSSSPSPPDHQIIFFVIAHCGQWGGDQQIPPNNFLFSAKKCVQFDCFGKPHIDTWLFFVCWGFMLHCCAFEVKVFVGGGTPPLALSKRVNFDCSTFLTHSPNLTFLHWMKWDDQEKKFLFRLIFLSVW